MDFSIPQQKAIDIRDTNVVVSASAGSGKTAVLSERVLNNILSGTDIDKMLIVTFTEAAALEMKERINITNKRITKNFFIIIINI